MVSLPSINPIPYWTLDADPNAGQWDVCSLTITGQGSVTLPGVAMMTPTLELDWQIPKNQGTDLQAITYKGLKPRRFELRLKITSSDQWNDFQQIVKKLSLDALGKVKSPYGLSHPYADLLGVQYVVIEKLVLPPPSARSVYVPVFSFIEWVDKPKTAQQQPPSTFGASGFQTKVPFQPGKP